MIVYHISLHNLPITRTHADNVYIGQRPLHENIPVCMPKPNASSALGLYSSMLATVWRGTAG